MFKALLDILRKEDLLTQAINDSYVMLEEDHEMYTESVKSLRHSDNSEMTINVFEKDKKVNKYEREVRRKVFIHLSVWYGKTDNAAALTLISIIIDIERIGDYTKNIMGLALDHPARLGAGKYEDELVTYENMLDTNFDRITEALKSSDKETARVLIREYRELEKWCDKVVTEIIKNETTDLTPGDAAALALYLRYIKRIGSHMRNITSSIVNPFHRLGYKEKKKYSSSI